SLDVVRTDPAPGTTTGFDDRVVASTCTWSSATSTMQSSPADARLAAAALLAPCVEGPLPQGATACVQAELAPRAEYDLLVRAVPANRPLGTAVVVARSHFTTSAYRNADELLAAAGFDADDPGADPIFPW